MFQLVNTAVYSSPIAPFALNPMKPLISEIQMTMKRLPSCICEDIVIALNYSGNPKYNFNHLT